MPEVALRFYRLDDAPLVLEAAHESVSDVGAWLEWCRTDLTLEEVRDWLAAQIENRKAGTAFEFAIVDSRGAYLGGCGINHVHPYNRFANLGYWVRSSAAGRGYAPAAVRAAARWAFAHTELRRLEIVCAVDNRRSQRVAEKAGAVREGVLRSRVYLRGRNRDAVLYSIVRSRAGAPKPDAARSRKKQP